jgi:hypothetical protein
MFAFVRVFNKVDHIHHYLLMISNLFSPLYMCKIAHLALNYLFTHSLAAGRLFSPGTLGAKNKTDRHDITEILLKVALSAMTITL